MKRKRQSRREALFQFDPDDVELPTQNDFQGYSALPQGRHKWVVARQQLPDRFEDSDDKNRAFVPAPVRIADPYDDEKRGQVSPGEEDDEEVTERPPSDDERERRRAIRVAPERRRRRREQAERERRGRDRPKTTSFMDIPLEIREEVYRSILIVDAPIQVRSGWKRVYARKRPGIETAILRACKSVYDEATRILYGENTFLYRLRDPTNRVANLEHLPYIDYAPDLEHDDDDDDEFKPADDDERAAARLRGRATGKGDTIDIAKFGCHFRRLIVEAERNRFSRDTQAAMAEAIKVFTPKKGRLAKTCDDGVKTTLRTFTIRVAPKYQLAKHHHHHHQQGGGGSGSFTFVDFFRRSSPVYGALKSLPCRFIRIDISTAFLNGGRDHPRFCRLTIDMQSLRFARYAARQVSAAAAPGLASRWRPDFWQSDRIIRQQRVARSRRCLAALRALEEHVARACRKHLAEHIREAVERNAEEDYDEAMEWASDDGGQGDFEEFSTELEAPEGVDEDGQEPDAQG